MRLKKELKVCQSGFISSTVHNIVVVLTFFLLLQQKNPLHFSKVRFIKIFNYLESFI